MPDPEATGLKGPDIVRARPANAGQNVLASQSGIVCQKIILGLTGGQEFKNELDGQAGPSYDWLAGHEFWVDDNALRKRHQSLPFR